MSRQRLFVIILIGLVLLAGGSSIRASQASVASAASAPPVAFSHQAHAQAGVQCLYCHSSATRSDVAGIPSIQECMGCHQTIAADQAPIQALADYWKRQEPIRWPAVNHLPDLVYFSHQPHLGAGLNCETCHGNVAGMTLARATTNMDMGWCLDCHLKQPQDKAARLTDCLLCHK